jgi:hypothetical protein
LTVVKGNDASATALEISLSVEALPRLGASSQDAAGAEAFGTLLVGAVVDITPDMSTRASMEDPAFAVALRVRLVANTRSRVVAGVWCVPIFACEAARVSVLADLN